MAFVDLMKKSLVFLIVTLERFIVVPAFTRLKPEAPDISIVDLAPDSSSATPNMFKLPDGV